MFTSYEFIFFLVGLLFVYYLVPKKVQWILLLFVNFLFYFSAGKIYPLFIVITATTVYFTGMFISKLEEKKTSFCSKNGLQPKDAGYKEEKKQY